MFSMVTSFACSESRSFSATLVNSSVMARPVKRELAITRRKAPSSSRTFERIRFAMKKATSSGSVTGSLRLGHEDRDAGLELRRLDRDRESPAESGLQPLLEALDFLGVAVAAQDHLVLAFQQLVEGMEELLLRALLAGEELDVIDQQRIE